MSEWQSDELKEGDWVRHKVNGSLGRVTLAGGELCIKPDSPNTPVAYPRKMFGEWQKDPNAKKIPVGQLASVAHAADRALCAVHHELQKQPDWLSLSAEERREWITGEVDLEHPLRVKLRKAVMEALTQ